MKDAETWNLEANLGPAEEPVFIGLAARYQFRRFPFLLFLLLEGQIGLLVCFVWQRWVP